MRPSFSFDCARSINSSACRRSSSAIIGVWLAIVDTTVTRTPRHVDSRNYATAQEGAFDQSRVDDDCLCRYRFGAGLRGASNTGCANAAKCQGQIVRTRDGKGGRDSMGAPATRSEPRVLVDDGRLTSYTSLEIPTRYRRSRSEARSGGRCCCASGLMRREGISSTSAAFPIRETNLLAVRRRPYLGRETKV